MTNHEEYSRHFPSEAFPGTFQLRPPRPQASEVLSNVPSVWGGLQQLVNRLVAEGDMDGARNLVSHTENAEEFLAVARYEAGLEELSL